MERNPECPAPGALERSVLERYSAAARRREEALCCPVIADPERLALLPREVVERDYGCGDPSRFVRSGETVLDLGSGSGKSCFLVSQVVGPQGRVLGIDMNDEMLALARGAAAEFALRVGWSNVEFRKGRIQDLRLDVERVDALLGDAPVKTAAELARLEERLSALRADRPLVPDASVDVVISNCVLNLVRPEDKQRLFLEIHRVLRPGGRAVIADIVSDEDVPEALVRDPELWSGCISGALREDRFAAAFAAAGLYGISVHERQERPWRVVAGIEFRSLTVTAYKGKEGPCLDRRQAVVYRGPFLQVQDDDGHVLVRGVRSAVCEKTFRILAREPYREHFDRIEPDEPVAPDEAPPFACNGGSRLRDPRETKSARAHETRGPTGGCGPEATDGCC